MPAASTPRRKMSRPLVFRYCGLCAAGSVVALGAYALWSGGVVSAAGGLAIRVEGNRLVDGNRHSVRLLGVNRSSFEYACAQGWGM
jgi:hypothetical protein